MLKLKLRPKFIKTRKMKRRLFRCTALIGDIFINETESVYCTVRTVCFCMMQNTVGLFTIKFWNILRHFVSEKY